MPMIRSERGKRVLAFLCTFLLVLDLALFPIRTHAAMSTALTAVGAAVTVSAFLAACGVYPYLDGEQTFGEWGAQKLTTLWEEYIRGFQGGQAPSGATLETFSTIKSFVVNGTLAITKATWDVLRGFAIWIVSNFQLTDNQTGLALTVGDNGYVTLPTVPEGATWDVVVERGFPIQLRVSDDSNYWCIASETEADLYVAYVGSGNSWNFCFYSDCELPPIIMANTYRNKLSTISPKVYTHAGRPMYWIGTNSISLVSQTNTLKRNEGIPYLERLSGDIHSQGASDFAATCWEALYGTQWRSGIMVDTGNVTIPAALPDDKDWAGLQVTTAGRSPVKVIEQGVTERNKPVVRPIEIEVPTGVELDTETGIITEDTIVITPEDVVPTVEALSPPASFLSALQTTMTTKFPFCLPFDLFKILQAFYVAPEAPIFHLSFHDPFSNSDFSIRVDLSPWDEVAAVVRNFEAMILLAGFCLNFDKFNVIHLILGGLG